MIKKIFLLGVMVSFLWTAGAAQEMEKPVLIKAGGTAIDCSPPYAAPLVVDYDRDGLDDLIVGTWKGNFRFYRNVGSKAAPAYKDFSLIQAGGKDAVARNW
jgi:hypothetical protein